MQIQLNDVRGGECALRQSGDEEFVTDPCARDANRALLFTSGMRCHDHAAQHALGPHGYLWAVVEATDHLTFRALLELIGRQMEARLHERMIKHTVLFAAGHEREASEIGEYGPGAILSVPRDAQRANRNAPMGVVPRSKRANRSA